MKWLLPFICAPLMCMTPARQTYVTHKAAHAVIGVAVCYAGAGLGYPKTGIAVAFGLGIAKELYDKKHGGSFRCGDVAWTGMPGATLSISFRW